MVGDDLLSRDYESRIFRGRLDRLPNVLIENARPLRTEPFVIRAFQIELPGVFLDGAGLTAIMSVLCIYCYLQARSQPVMKVDH